MMTKIKGPKTLFLKSLVHPRYFLGGYDGGGGGNDISFGTCGEFLLLKQPIV